MGKNKTKKDVYYFPHDFNPTSDPKMLAFVGEYGAVGYGIYWRIVEMLHESSEHVLPLKKYIYSALAKQMLTDVEQVFKIVESCINDYELFETDDEYFWCNRVLRNVEKRIDLIAKKVKAGEASAEARKNKKIQEENITCVQHNSTDVQHVLTDVQHNLTEGNKLNEIKLNETKKNNINSEISKNKNNLFTFSEIITELKLEGTQKNLILAQYKTDSNTINKYIDFFAVQYTPETETETFSLNEKRIHFKNFLKNNWGKLSQIQVQTQQSFSLSDETKQKLSAIYIASGAAKLLEKYITTRNIDEVQGINDFERAKKQNVDYMNLQLRVNGNEKIYNY